MIDLPAELDEKFAKKVARSNVPDSYLNFYRKWLRFYLDLCHKYGSSPSGPQSLDPFLEKLRVKKQSLAYQRQAHHAVVLYRELLDEQGKVAPTSAQPRSKSTHATASSPHPSRDGSSATLSSTASGEGLESNPPLPGPPIGISREAMQPPPTEAAPPAIAQWHKAVANLAAEIKVRHYSPKSLKSYATPGGPILYS